MGGDLDARRHRRCSQALPSEPNCAWTSCAHAIPTPDEHATRRIYLSASRPS